MTRAIGYIRVSTEEQSAEGVSLADQRDRLTAYCTFQRLALTGIIEDAGVSAGKPLAQRPGGARVEALIAEGDVEIVVAIKLDRLFRDAVDCLTCTRAWDRRSVALHLIDVGGQGLDTSSAMGRFFLTVMAGCAEMERNLIRERTSAALQHMRRNGQRVGQVPYGFAVGDLGALVPHPYEQQVIDEIRAHRADGVSLRAIAAALTSDGWKPRGQRWHINTISRVLRADFQA